jgi:hypothetical protein
MDGEPEAAEYEGEKKDEKDNSHEPFPSAGSPGADTDYPAARIPHLSRRLRSQPVPGRRTRVRTHHPARRKETGHRAVRWPRRGRPGLAPDPGHAPYLVRDIKLLLSG